MASRTCTSNVWTPGTLTQADGGTIARPDEQQGASQPSLSADGSVVAFTTDADNLDPADTDGRADVYVRDLGSGAVRLASVNADGIKGAAPSGEPSLSGDGTIVAFATGSANLLPEDTDPSSDVYVKDLTDGSLQLGSTDGSGTKANQSASYPSLSAGRSLPRVQHGRDEPGHRHPASGETGLPEGPEHRCAAPGIGHGGRHAG